MSSTRTSTISPIDRTVVISHEASGLVHVIGGYAEDSNINIEHDAETYQHHTGIDNVATRIHNANTSGKITISLAESSASNDVLYALHQYDVDSRSNKGLFSLTIKDGSGRSVMFSQEAYIGVVPNQQYGASVNNREWVFHCTRMTNVLGGNGLVSPEDAAGIDQLGGNLADEWRL